jgi:hypothetical protein
VAAERISKRDHYDPRDEHLYDVRTLQELLFIELVDKAFLFQLDDNGVVDKVVGL